MQSLFYKVSFQSWRQLSDKTIINWRGRWDYWVSLHWVSMKFISLNSSPSHSFRKNNGCNILWLKMRRSFEKVLVEQLINAFLGFVPIFVVCCASAEVALSAKKIERERCSLLDSLWLYWDLIRLQNLYLLMTVNSRVIIDFVDHGILLEKRVKAMECILSWFPSYSANRKQKIVLKYSSKVSLRIKVGVSHESVLAPLLFLVYINDLPKI